MCLPVTLWALWALLSWVPVLSSYLPFVIQLSNSGQNARHILASNQHSCFLSHLFWLQPSYVNFLFPSPQINFPFSYPSTIIFLSSKYTLLLLQYYSVLRAQESGSFSHVFNSKYLLIVCVGDTFHLDKQSEEASLLLWSFKEKQVTTITVFFTLTHNNQMPLRRVIAQATNLMPHCVLIYMEWNDSPWELEERGTGKPSESRAVA